MGLKKYLKRRSRLRKAMKYLKRIEENRLMNQADDMRGKGRYLGATHARYRKGA